jgi:putative copper export protein
MSRLYRLVATTTLLACAGCYHATVETGAAPSTEVIHQTFASSWVYGLVPPKTVAAESRCPSGVSKVETQHSFVNQLVGFLTLGIYTPMEIEVTCAAAGK